jgi:hypothetical protein
MTKERKQVLLTPIIELVKALYKEDIPAIIHLLDRTKIYLRYSSDVINYVKELLIEDIKIHIESCTRKRTLKVTRKDVYHNDTVDKYTIKDNILYRNGDDVTWTSIGKLYQAYKFIHKIE